MKNYDINGDLHGFCEFKIAGISVKGYYEHGVRDGYWEFHWYNEKIMAKGDYKDGKRNKYWQWFDDEGKVETKEYNL